MQKFSFKTPDNVQQLCVMLAEREAIQTYASPFFSVLLADLNVLLTNRHVIAYRKL